MALKLHMYFQSIFWLFPLLAIKDFTLEDQTTHLPIEGWRCFFRLNPMIGLTIASLVLLAISFLWMKKILRGSKAAEKVTKVENASFEMMAFLATYVIPFTATSSQDLRSLIVMALLLIALGIISMRSNSFYMNPTLGLLGYRIYKIELDGKSVGHIAISRQQLTDGTVVRCQSLDHNVLFTTLQK